MIDIDVSRELAQSLALTVLYQVAHHDSGMSEEQLNDVQDRLTQALQNFGEEIAKSAYDKVRESQYQENLDKRL